MDEPSLTNPQKRGPSQPDVRQTLRQAVPYFAGIVTVFAALVIYTFINPPARPYSEEDVRGTIAAVMASATPRPAYSADVYQIIQPSLVLIETHEGDPGEEGGSLGSGVLVNLDGSILTSLHVVEGADKIEVVFADGTKSAAEVAASEPQNDIAVLRPLQLPEVLVPAVLGNPNAMRVGDEAYAVGNPFGLYSSMSAGVISGFERSFKTPGSDVTLEGLIQIDTAVNPGNSGGPLLNRYGEVIGIVTGIANPTRQEVFIGIGFAVPITTAGGGAGAPPY